MSFFTGLFSSTKRKPEHITSALDMVNYAASLVSNPDDVDQMLDVVRSITSQPTAGRQLSAAETEKLLGVYARLETYLTTREPLRKFDQATLRARFDPQLRENLEKHERAKVTDE